MSKISIKELGKRLFVSAISLFVLAIFIYFSKNEYFKPVFALLVAIVASIGVYEYVKLVEHKKILLNKKLMVFACFLQIFSFYLYSQIAGLKLLPVIIFFLLVFLFFMSHFNKTEGALSYIALSSLGIIYIAVPLGLIFPILYLRPIDGIYWLVFLIAVTKISDVGAYFGGKLFGKHKLAAKISPNKTIEGAVVGLIFSIALSYLFYLAFNHVPHFYPKLRSFVFLTFGFCLGIVGQISDLAESLLKRDAGVKDSNTIPGFGGILDMVDSLLFNIPLFFFFLEVAI